MKQIITTIIILLLFFKAVDSKAQITLEQTYSHYGYFETGYLTNGGLVYWYIDTNNVVYVYNKNHTLLSTFSLYVPIGYVQYGGLDFISDNLFNADNFIEVAYTTSSGFSDSSFVINQNAIILSERGSFQDISKEGTNFKLITRDDIGLNAQVSKVYSLPGTYPCDACSILSGISGPNSGSVQKISNAYPNPANSPITISYHLPVGVYTAEILITDVQGKEVGGYRIGKDFSDILIPVDNLSSGQYFYSIITNNQIIDSGKFFISK